MHSGSGTRLSPQTWRGAGLWMKVVAEAGLALLYGEGKLVPRDPERAKELYKKAGF